jgi:hypothetical protein
MLINGWHSDKTGERRLHTAIPFLAAGSMFALLTLGRHNMPLAILSLLLGSGFLHAYYPTFWAIPTIMLSEAAAAATFRLINSIGPGTTRLVISTIERMRLRPASRSSH